MDSWEIQIIVHIEQQQILKKPFVLCIRFRLL